MKKYKYLILLFSIISCKSTIPLLEIGQTNSKLTFVKINNGNNNYEMKVPELSQNQYVFLQKQSGHGHGFEFNYSDNSTLYFKNDWAVPSLNFKNYALIDFKKPNRNLATDTVISGVLPNGNHWKEIIKGEDYLGYTNVTRQSLPFFNESLGTLKKINTEK